MAWVLRNISWVTNYMTVAGWQNIADLIGGEVKSAEDWGITSVSGLYSDASQPSVDNLAVYVPEGANYGMIAFGGGGSGTYYQNNCLYFVPMETGDVTVAGSCALGINQRATTVRVWADNDFSVVTSLPDAQYSQGGFALDTFEDAVNETTVLGVVGSSTIQSNLIYNGFDLEYGGALSNAPSGVPLGTAISQSDGSLYLEVINLPLLGVTDNQLSKVLIAEHLYASFYDYSYSDKNVLVNGIVFSELLSRGIYFPTE